MIVPSVRVTNMARAVDFYAKVLDFDHAGTWPDMADPCFTILLRHGYELHLSSHGGDGVIGQKVMVLVDDVDALHAAFVTRGLDQRHRHESPIHLGPTDQTWGTREFCADDPDGNGIIFAQR
jgi:catechol 2,3-dioxygenase-like lactoylglutathione lyase family enzyme